MLRHIAHVLSPSAAAAAPAKATAPAADVHAYVNQIANGAHVPSVGLGCAYVGDESTGLTQEAQTAALVTAALNAGCEYCLKEVHVDSKIVYLPALGAPVV
jgi:hypothetical protein